MEAKAGDVFCVYNYYLKKYTACQVTKLDDKDDNVQAVVLSLDWSGDQPLSADSLPEDAAKAAKQLYKKQKEQDGLSLWIQKARKPEWLAQNLDNPFRSWDGQENISAAVAKKAAAQYRKTRSEILQLMQNPSENLQALAAAAVVAYVDEFNKMDKKKMFIETVEREDIYTALCTILDLIPDDSAVDKDAILEVFENLRDF